MFDNKQVVIAGMDLRIDTGEFLAVLGPSGSGKSTLLRMIARLAEPDSGRILTEPDGDRFQTAFVFQDAHLLPWRNVLDNAALPLELMGEAKAKRDEKARAALEQVGLLEALDRYPAQLSGGMRMRQTGLMSAPPAACEGYTRKPNPVRDQPASRPESSASMSGASALTK